MKSTQSSHSSLFLWVTHTLSVNTSHGIFIPLILRHVHYHLLLAPGNLLQSCNSLCLLGYKGHFLFSLHCSTLSLSDFPPEGSGWGRHPSDSARQEPGPQGRSSKGLHWKRAVFSAAWSLHRLSGVSIVLIYGLLLFKLCTCGIVPCVFA